MVVAGTPADMTRVVRAEARIAKVRDVVKRVAAQEETVEGQLIQLKNKLAKFTSENKARIDRRIRKLKDEVTSIIADAVRHALAHKPESAGDVSPHVEKIVDHAVTAPAHF